MPVTSRRVTLSLLGRPVRGLAVLVQLLARLDRVQSLWHAHNLRQHLASAPSLGGLDPVSLPRREGGSAHNGSPAPGEGWPFMRSKPS